MGLGFAERRACCLLCPPGSGREGIGRDAPPELRDETLGIYLGCWASGSLRVKVGEPGTLGGKNWGGRIVHLNMKLITCKYNANDMQMSTGFL